jgi:hypothetical protein
MYGRHPEWSTNGEVDHLIDAHAGHVIGTLWQSNLCRWRVMVCLTLPRAMLTLVRSEWRMHASATAFRCWITADFPRSREQARAVVESFIDERARWFLGRGGGDGDG